MSEPIEDYLASLRRELGTIPEADDVVAEINDHLREACSSPTCPDAEPARLAERAIERFGEAATVAREVRMERGRLRGTDPVPIHTWIFTIAEVMLILAAVVYGLASWIYHQSCSADFDALGDTGRICGDRREASELAPLPALPVGFDGLTPSPATQILFLVAALLMAGALAFFIPRQPWFASMRRTASTLGALTLVTAAAVVVHLGDPVAGLPWWGCVPALGVDLACVCAVAQVWIDPPDLSAAVRSTGRRPPESITFSRYRSRASLILVSAAGAGGLHLLQLPLLGPLFAIIDAIRHGFGLEWSLPLWVLYQAHTVAIAAPAVFSLLLGRSGRRPVLGSGALTVSPGRNPKVTGEDSPVTLGAVRY